jgi:hypothetical protein
LKRRKRNAASDFFSANQRRFDSPLQHGSSSEATNQGLALSEACNHPRRWHTKSMRCISMLAPVTCKRFLSLSATCRFLACRTGELVGAC